MFPYNSPLPDGSRPQQTMSNEHLAALRSLADLYDSHHLIAVIKSFEGPTYDPNARMSQSTLSSNASVPSAWSASQASLVTSDAASILSLSTQATWGESATEMTQFFPADQPSFVDHSGTWSPAPSAPEPRVPDSPMSAAAVPSGSDKSIQCTMCYVELIKVEFSRKSDFKKHLQRFHCTNGAWTCPMPDCGATYDFEKAFVAHVKAVHSDAPLPSGSARAELCPQLVFACGFRDCKDRVFEAESEDDVSTVRDKYFNHVAKHFDEGSSVTEWRFFTQIGNLLRQKALKETWKTNVWQKAMRNRLRWQPRASADLKRLLECRHLGDITKLLTWAYQLGDGQSGTLSSRTAEFPEGFSRPVRMECPFAASGHEALPKGVEGQQSYQFHIPHLRQPTPHAVFPPPSRGRTPNLVPRPRPLYAISEPEGYTINNPDGYAHPGTPLPIPEVENWPEEDSMFGPPVSDGMPNTSSLVANPIGSVSSPEALPHWPLAGVESLPQAFPTNPTTPTSSRPKTPKRPLSALARSMDNIRMKRRNGASVDISPPQLPSGMIPTTAGFDLPMRTSHNVTSHPGVHGPTFYNPASPM